MVGLSLWQSGFYDHIIRNVNRYVHPKLYREQSNYMEL